MCTQMGSTAQFTVLTRVALCHTSGTSPPDGTAITAHSRVSRVWDGMAVLPGSIPSPLLWICGTWEPEKAIASRYESRQWRTPRHLAQSTKKETWRGS